MSLFSAVVVSGLTQMIGLGNSCCYTTEAREKRDRMAPSRLTLSCKLPIRHSCPTGLVCAVPVNPSMFRWSPVYLVSLSASDLHNIFCRQ